MAIQPEFGTMEDFDRLLAQAHLHGIKIILDLVLDTTSDLHPWFSESRSSKDNRRRDYYFWKPAKDGHEPNNWGAYFAPSAWNYDELTAEYYLAHFSPRQPDLNWECVELREEIFTMVNGWLAKGVDGFRLDVINLIKKPVGLPDSLLPPNTPFGYVIDEPLFFNNSGLLELLQEFHNRTLAGKDVLIVGETCNVTPAIALPFIQGEQAPMNMVFHFEITDTKTNWSLEHIKAVQKRWVEGVFNQGGWLAQHLGNHDQPRMVSIYGDDGHYRIESAKLLATLLHTLPGTPYLYQGDEIGMTNPGFERIEQYRDIFSFHNYQGLIQSGLSPEEALAKLSKVCRDNGRTPLQWDDSKNAGFSSGIPWIEIGKNYKEINVKNALAAPNSVFHYYQTLISLRKENPLMVYGDYEDLLPAHKQIYAYRRSLNGKAWYIVLNFSPQTIENPIPLRWEKLLGNYPSDKENMLRPYEAAIYTTAPGIRIQK